MRCLVVIAILVAVCCSAPVENPTELVALATDSTTAAIAVPDRISQTEQTPLPAEKPITNQPLEEPHKVEDHPQVINNLNKPDAKPNPEHPEERPLVPDNIEPEVYLPLPDHHGQEISQAEQRLPVDKLITNQPQEELHEVEHLPQAINNLNQPDSKPNIEHPEEKPLVPGTNEPELNTNEPELNRPDHHIQEHIINEPSEKPALHPVVPEEKPELEETGSKEDSDEELDLLQQLGLLALTYELELLEELEQLENIQKHRKGHRNHHKHGHRIPNKDD